jgi:hypothetical protein
MTDKEKGIIAYEALKELMKLDVDTMIDVRDIIIAFDSAERKLRNQK